MAMAMMAALFVACGDDGTDDETPPPAVPTIALDGGDIDQPQEITNPMSVKVSVTAPGAIAGFTVTIDSPALTATSNLVWIHHRRLRQGTLRQKPIMLLRRLDEDISPKAKLSGTVALYTTTLTTKDNKTARRYG